MYQIKKAPKNSNTFANLLTSIPKDPVSVLVICLGEELGCKNPVDDDAGEGEDWGYAVSSSADVKIVGKIDGIMRELLRDSGRFTKL